MRPIGWILACLLLTIVIPKNTLFACAVETEDGTSGKELSSVLDLTGHEILEFFKDIFHGETENQDPEARTFGHKRIQFMLMPMMYKMGVMMTMLTVLTVISLKGLLIGVTLLVLKLSTLIAKFSTGWHQHQPAVPSWPVHPSQPIHLHLHNSFPTAHNQAYNGWIPDSAPGDDEHYYYKG